MESQTVRATALLAGNGIILTKIFDIFMMEPSADGRETHGIALFAIFPLLGITMAYGMLRSTNKGPLRAFEFGALFAFVLPILIWLVLMYFNRSN